MAKDAKIEGINKLDSILGNKKKFRRFLVLVLIVGILGVAGVACWKGCSIETKNNKFKVKARPIK